MDKVRWGVLSTAKIARKWIIPALNESASSEVVAIASRNIEPAMQYAEEFDIPTAYGAYEALLNDSNVDAIYNPLPNNLHVPWTVKALEAGKHVLCEKPIGLNIQDLAPLLKAMEQNPQLKVMEAYMYRFHPQWAYIKNLISSGGIGQIASFESSFSYNTKDKENIRNKPDMGGGALMDIGCYCISAARHVFGEEPQSVVGIMIEDDAFKVDINTSGLLRFSTGVARFVCSMQSESSQSLRVLGREGSISLDSPYYQKDHDPLRMIIQRGGKQEMKVVPTGHNQYVEQVEAFSQSIIQGTTVPTPIDDAVANMRVIDALAESSRIGAWVDIP